VRARKSLDEGTPGILVANHGLLPGDEMPSQLRAMLPFSSRWHERRILRPC
jgi:hypothetical protein